MSDRLLGQRFGIQERHPGNGWLRPQMEYTVRTIDRSTTFVAIFGGSCRLAVVVLFALFHALAGL